MRKLGLSLLVSAAVLAPVAALSQESQPAASADDYVCAFAGECAEEAADEPPAEADRRPARGRASRRPAASLSRRNRTSDQRRPTAPTPRRGNRADARPRRCSSRPPSRRARAASASTCACLRRPARPRCPPPRAPRRAPSPRRCCMPQLANMRVRIEGHTDCVGGRATNITLSQRRAQAVADFWSARASPPTGSRCAATAPTGRCPARTPPARENRRVEAVRIS